MILIPQYQIKFDFVGSGALPVIPLTSYNEYGRQLYPVRIVSESDDGHWFAARTVRFAFLGGNFSCLRQLCAVRTIKVSQVTAREKTSSAHPCPETGDLTSRFSLQMSQILVTGPDRWMVGEPFAAIER
jgi:hypothetical protein